MPKAIYVQLAEVYGGGSYSSTTYDTSPSSSSLEKSDPKSESQGSPALDTQPPKSAASPSHSPSSSNQHIPSSPTPYLVKYSNTPPLETKVIIDPFWTALLIVTLLGSLIAVVSRYINKRHASS